MPTADQRKNNLLKRTCDQDPKNVSMDSECICNKLLIQKFHASFTNLNSFLSLIHRTIGNPLIQPNARFISSE